LSNATIDIVADATATTALLLALHIRQHYNTAQCTGAASSYSIATNSCSPQQCGRYFVYTYSPNKDGSSSGGSCKLSPALIALVWLVGIVLLLLDFGSTLVHRYLAVTALALSSDHPQTWDYRAGQALCGWLEESWRVLTALFCSSRSGSGGAAAAEQAQHEE
jgi:hypothetical protein